MEMFILWKWQRHFNIWKKDIFNKLGQPLKNYSTENYKPQFQTEKTK